jgi:integrase
MGRTLHKLSARFVATVTKPGLVSDGAGLYLQIDKGGSKSWSFVFYERGKRRQMGLGGLTSVPLALARERAAECRKAVATGADPIAERRAAANATPSFGEFADEFLKSKSPGWRNAKHRAQWAMTLREYAAPLRQGPVNEIDTPAVLAVLQPLWLSRPETASRLRGRIENVLDAARAAGHRTGENPARWRGHLDKLLPAPQKLSRGHHKAMSYEAMPEFMAALRERPGLASLAMELLVLTASRSSEALGARWDEVDLAAATWTVPASRMKSNRPHRVPLSDRALEILAEARQLGDGGDFIFSGQKRGRPLSSMALAMLLRRMAIADATPHGMRSSFRDWGGDKTSFSREVAEAALAHAVGDETERAYRRSDALAKRRELMAAWSNYCGSTPGESDNVVAGKFGSARS